jgi:hypothetical protein
VSDLAFLLSLNAAALVWLLFCAAMNHRPEPRPLVTDPGREAIAALTACQPAPTGRHRTPDDWPLLPFYRTTRSGGEC